MLAEGDHAPAFELPDLSGQSQRLEAEPREPVLLVFWKPSCRTCHIAFPYLKRLRETYPKGWRLLAVSQDAEPATRRFAEQYGLPFPVLLEGEGWPVSNQYDPEATPTSFLIGPNGSIELVSVGFDKAELNEIARRIAERLDLEPVTIAEDGDGNPRFRPG